ncbi:hypothetical protein [Cupriavidus pauculus]|uniref:hypothetical protein n=1 Tax=Cupriavidus pauculus TaxID=82633 RepID=UPI001FD36D68|nr:hypothetical protein [Cupriavidus pauculus]
MLRSSRTTVLIAIASLALGACAVPPMYSPVGEIGTQARIRVKANDRYAFPAIVTVKAIDDVEPKEQYLAIFFKGWMGMGAEPKKAELIGMPETTGEDATLPVLERYITGNRPLRLQLDARVDGNYICGDAAAFTPTSGHDYELVVPLRGTSLGFSGACSFILYEIVPKGNSFERLPLAMTRLADKKK